MQVKWLRAARANLEAAAEYVSKDSSTSAERLVLRILDAVNQLKTHPAMGRPGRVPGTRELVVPGTPYIVPYRVRGGNVEIIRVLHAARRWPWKF